MSPGLIKAQAALSTGDRLLMGLAGMILSHLVHVFMLANESSLWVSLWLPPALSVNLISPSYTMSLCLLWVTVQQGELITHCATALSKP